MGNVNCSNCLSAEASHQSNLDLQTPISERRTDEEHKFFGLKILEQLPNCICSKDLSEREFVYRPNDSFYTYTELERRDNDMIRKLLLEEDHQPVYDEFRMETSKEFDQLAEFDQEVNISIEGSNIKSEVTPGDQSFSNKAPYQVVSKEASKNFSIGELFTRAQLNDIDMSKVLPGVVYPVSDYYRLQDNSTYRGELNKSHLPHGRGFLFLPDGSVYFGYFFDGVPKGAGKYLNHEGLLTEGEFLTIESGPTSYNGTSFVVHGHGSESWPDGTVYIGSFHMGLKQGQGRLTLKGLMYEGEFFNNLFNGEGKITYENGDEFQGQWADGLKHGYGELRCKNGKIYKGQYENDEKTGEGTMIWPDKRRYQGDWVNGKQHGIGLYTFFDKAKGKLRTGRSQWQEGQKLRWMSPND